MNDRSHMVRPLGAVLAVLALLVGFVAAPQAHVHQSAAASVDALHASDTALIHSHLAPHRRANVPADDATPPDDHETQQIWSIDGFLFQPGTASHAPVPALLPAVVTSIESPGSLLEVWLATPNNHGPPPDTGSDLRAPPTFLPSLV